MASTMIYAHMNDATDQARDARTPLAGGTYGHGQRSAIRDAATPLTRQRAAIWQHKGDPLRKEYLHSKTEENGP